MLKLKTTVLTLLLAGLSFGQVDVEKGVIIDEGSKLVATSNKEMDIKIRWVKDREVLHCFVLGHKEDYIIDFNILETFVEGEYTSFLTQMENGEDRFFIVMDKESVLMINMVEETYSITTGKGLRTKF